MLTSLSIRNVVLIEKLDVDFSKALSVFTGETGAGKSILLDALAFVLGARSDAKMIRHGADGMSAAASFTVPKTHAAHGILAEQDLACDGEIILRRTLSKDGKTKAFVNDEPVGVALLKNLGEALVEIHGQFASHRLLNSAVHVSVLDSYGALAADVKKVQKAFISWREKSAECEALERDLAAARQEEDFIRASVAELSRLDPKAGEETELADKRARLMNAEKIIENARAVFDGLADEQAGALSKITQLYRPLEKVNQLSNNQFKEVLELVDGAEKNLTAALSQLENQMDGMENADDLAAADDRLFALKDVARKHHATVDELPIVRERLEKRLAELDTGEDKVVNLRKEAAAARLAYMDAAAALTKKRKATAKELDGLVNAELPALKLGKAKFMTEVTALSEADWTMSGADKVVFLASTNAGVPAAPIHKIASGGELNRFMLALKVILAAAEDIPTIVFDEVDTGIGGATADAVGDRLAKLSAARQVLVVTHSAQVAAWGAHHFTVQKNDTKNGVVTEVTELSPAGRLDEIARMVSGAEITESSKTVAKELLEICQKKFKT